MLFIADLYILLSFIAQGWKGTNIKQIFISVVMLLENVILVQILIYEFVLNDVI